jgi:hypothetical protein
MKELDRESLDAISGGYLPQILTAIAIGDIAFDAYQGFRDGWNGYR